MPPRAPPTCASPMPYRIWPELPNADDLVVRRRAGLQAGGRRRPGRAGRPVRDDAAPIVGAVAYMRPGADLDELGATRVARLRGLFGLGARASSESELAEPSWIVVDAEPDDVFSSDPDELWRTVVQRKGGRFSLLATMPFDPGLN